MASLEMHFTTPEGAAYIYSSKRVCELRAKWYKRNGYAEIQVKSISVEGKRKTKDLREVPRGKVGKVGITIPSTNYTILFNQFFAKYGYMGPTPGDLNYIHYRQIPESVYVYVCVLKFPKLY